MPELSNAYCTEELVKQVLGNMSGAEDDTWLRLSINAASRQIEDHTGQRFWLDPEVVTRDFYVADNARRVRLSAGSSPSVLGLGTLTGAVVKLDAGSAGAFATTLAEGTDFLYEPINADVNSPAAPFTHLGFELSGAAYFNPPSSRYGKPTVRVTGRWGWPAVPAQVEQACALQAAQLFKAKDAVFGVVAFGDSGPMRVNSAMNPIAAGLLAAFTLDFIGM